MNADILVDYVKFITRLTSLNNIKLPRFRLCELTANPTVGLGRLRVLKLEPKTRAGVGLTSL